MRLIMKTLAAGPDWRGGPGEVVNVPDAEAKALIDGGFAMRAVSAAPASEPPTAPADAPKEPEAPAEVEEVEVDDREEHEKAGDEAFEAAKALGMSDKEAAAEAVAASAKFPDSPYFKPPTAPADAPKEPVNGSEADHGADAGAGDASGTEAAPPG
jgi:hypothetical protein